MTNWILIHNPKYFNLDKLVLDRDVIDWQQRKNKFSIGDTVYLYSTSPDKRIKYRGTVIGTDILESDIRDDSEYWVNRKAYYSGAGKWIKINIDGFSKENTLKLSDLKEHGLTASMQGPTKKLSKELIKFIDDNIINNDNVEYPDSEGLDESLTEGSMKTVQVNAYERNPIARMECIKAKVCYCHVCGIDFSKEYGEFASGFIHVHHIIPIHEIKKEYIIDPINDLIPVCPNCHAMLHRKLYDGSYYSVDELKEKLAGKRNFRDNI